MIGVRMARGSRVLRAMGVVSLFWCLAPIEAQDVFIDFGSDWRLFRGQAEPSEPVADWRETGFDDGAWELAPAGIGYGDGDDVTELLDMEGAYTSIYTRAEFDVANPGAVGSLLLSIDFDDGFVAYIGGQEVARANLGNSGDDIAFDAVADGNHEAGVVEFFELDPAVLVAGRNVLAIQVHNTAIGSSDLSFDARLSSNDPRGSCPGSISCEASLDGVTVSWDSNGDYDSIVVTRDGDPLPGSPFPGGTTEVVDAAGAGRSALYEVVARVDGVDCPAISCTSESELVVLPVGADWRFLRGSEAPPADWADVGFDDAAWEVGPTGIGYGDDDDATVVEDMEGSYTSLFLRREFSMPAGLDVRNLTLRIDYDDGFLAFLNGEEVARSASVGGAIGDPVAFDATTQVGREAGAAEDFNLTSRLDALRAGTNVLAIHVLNTAVASSDLSILPSLVVNSCPIISGFACVPDANDGSVTISWTTSSTVDSIVVTRNGEPIAGSPFAGDVTSVVDQNVGPYDVDYELTPIIAGFRCPSVTCDVTCEDRSPGLLTCALSIVAGETQAELSWTAPIGGSESIEVRREGALLATLPSGATSYTDPDVESDQPEDDTDFTVVYVFSSGEECTIACGPIDLCLELTCARVDDGGVLRAELSWTNIVKVWEGFTIQRDGVDVATLPAEARAWTDQDVELVFGADHDYTLVPIAPVGEEAACDQACTLGGAVRELADYDEPDARWSYFLRFDELANLQYERATGVEGNVDGSWIRAIDADRWDGSAPGDIGAAPSGSAPGGIGLSSADGSACEGAVFGVLHVLNPGDPSDPAGSLATEFPEAYDAPANSEFLLGLDAGVADRNLLRDGVTFTARWRVSPESPSFLNAQESGDGTGLQAGLGQVGFYYRDANDTGGNGGTAGAALTLQTGGLMQLSSAPVTTLPGADIETFRSVWVTVVDPEGDETYDVTVYLNGEEVPTTELTLVGTDLQAGTADFGAPIGNYLAIGAPGAAQDADVEFDYVGWSAGVHEPFSTPCVPSDNNRPTARVSASPGTSVALEGGTAEVVLDGGASDDGDGGAQGLSYQWTKLSGPAGDAIETPDGMSTRVTFSEAGSYRYQLRVDDGEPALSTASTTIEITVTGGGVGGDVFLRGDADGTGVTNITDGIYVLNFLFLGGDDPPCADAADADDSGVINITDGIYILNFLFLGGDDPPPPLRTCGVDPTDDAVGCAQSPVCP